MSIVEMVKGVILIGLVFGWEERVLREIRKFEGVKDAFPVYGEYDGVVLFEMGGQDRLNSTIARIRRMEGVTRTITLVAW